MRATEREVREAEGEVRMMPTLDTYPSYECYMLCKYDKCPPSLTLGTTDLPGGCIY